MPRSRERRPEGAKNFRCGGYPLLSSLPPSIINTANILAPAQGCAFIEDIVLSRIALALRFTIMVSINCGRCRLELRGK